MGLDASGLKLTVEKIFREYDGLFYILTISNTGSTDEHVVSLGAHLTDDKSKQIPIESPKIMGYITIPSGENYSISISEHDVANCQNLAFFITTQAGVVVPSTKLDKKTSRRITLMKISKRISPTSRPLPKTMTLILLAIGGIVVLALFAWVAIINHNRSTYEAVGSIVVSPENQPTKYYVLKVGDLNAAAKAMGATDTIFVGNSAAHWYSISNHKTYSVTTATWPDGQKLTLSNYVNDQVNNEAYAVGPGCTIPTRKARVHCIGDDGKGYYVSLETVGTDIVEQLNGPQ